MTFEEIEECFPDGGELTNWNGSITVSAQWLHDFAKNVIAREQLNAQTTGDSDEHETNSRPL